MAERIVFSFTHSGDELGEQELDDLAEEVARVVARLVPDSELEDSYTEDA